MGVNVRIRVNPPARVGCNSPTSTSSCMSCRATHSLRAA
jgi:hypothetical protein